MAVVPSTFLVSERTMECLKVLIFLLVITTAYGAPIYKEPSTQTDDLLKQEQASEGVIPIQRNQRYLQPEMMVEVVDLMNEPIGRSKFPPSAGSGHSLLSELKKNIPLVPPLKLGLHKPAAGGGDKLNSDCKTSHLGLPLLAGLQQLGLTLSPKPTTYSAQPEQNVNQAPHVQQVQQAQGEYPQPQFYHALPPVSHIPVSWETYITEEEKPHIHYATVPYINGYKLAPVYTEKKIELKEYVNQHGDNHHFISPYPIPYPHDHHVKSDQEVQTGRTAGRFIPSELQQPYGLDINIQNHQIMARNGKHQPTNFSDQAYSDMIKTAKQFFEQSQMLNPKLNDFNSTLIRN